VVSTLAGPAASLLNPEGIAVDTGGNVYVADTGNHTIRKITPEGIVSTLAGSAGQSGTANGAGDVARFNQPTGVAVDASGNVFVADMNNHAIRKITPSGDVTTLAGSIGNPGDLNGTGTGAYFNYPHGLSVDGSGNLYVADSGNNMIRIVSSTGVVTRLAGVSGKAGSSDDLNASALFYWPVATALDASGNVYVADKDSNAIRKITTEAITGHVTTIVGLAGKKFNATGALPASIDVPSGVAVDPTTTTGLRLFISVPGAILKVSID
jgi:streptogramin lyase